MTKLYASFCALGLLAVAPAAMADCAAHQPAQSAQTVPVVTSDAATAPMTPVPVQAPAPTTTAATKTGS